MNGAVPICPIATNRSRRRLRAEPRAGFGERRAARERRALAI
jgi:hypothetical protein